MHHDRVTVYKWLRIGLLNLVIVALYGLLMRYKIAFDFPFFQQKHLLHAHSHFAFSGWISHFLYSGIAGLVFPYISKQRKRQYNWLIALNLLSAFGMLVSFTAQGYKMVSISFSTFSIVIAIFFAIFFVTDRKQMPKVHPASPWAVAALLFNVVSAAGPLSLAYMMASKNFQPNFYLGSVYYYLHFQYSGWFFFGAIAIAIGYFNIQLAALQKYFKLFVLTTIPTFGLSVLWAKLPAWLYVIVVVATLAQLVGWISLVVKLQKAQTGIKAADTNRTVRLFFYIAVIALSVKFCLQAISVIPSLSQLVFGFRPIVIAYLHLVFLGVYSLFILGFLFSQGVIVNSKAVRIAAYGFLTGVVLNEALLGIQGFAAFAYVSIPYINEMLLAAAFVLAVSAAFIFLYKGRLSNATIPAE
ncbi:MAG TPA: hypothetical protein VLC98_14740 [Phnomibacter sp.]|nr:hypothetical protein [Phnomibacter sp.]